MDRIKWYAYTNIEDESIPKDVDLLLTVENCKTNERKVIIAKLIIHKICPGVKGTLTWVGVAPYFFDENKIIAWTNMIKSYQMEEELENIKNNILNAKHKQDEATLAINQLFGLLNEYDINLDSITDAPNADNLSDAINCYITYGEYTIDRLMDEIYKAIQK